MPRSLRLSEFEARKPHLSLAERDRVELGPPKPFILGKLEQRHGGVGARGEDKDEGGAAVRVRVGTREIKGGRLNEALPQLVRHEYGDRRDNLCRRRQ